MIKLRRANLSEYTTIKLGGIAENFAECESTDDIKEALKFANSRNLPAQILSGGSNTVFADEGYRGLIIKISTRGIKNENGILVAEAGEEWDKVVEFAVNNGLTGIECLSGIPGLTGATPIQNVGAYGQEVSETIESVTVLDRNSFEVIEFQNSECGFSYRDSRFKSKDKNKYVVLRVRFRLNPGLEPNLKYRELIERIGTIQNYKSLDIKEKLKTIRKAVLEIRKEKSMVSEKTDVNSYSCGSFFTNPVISREKTETFKSTCSALGLNPVIYENNGMFKISAAWLIENSGFSKGYTINGAGISEKHTLALVNRGGTTKDLLDLAGKIKQNVYNKFGIELEFEPEIVKP